MSGPQPPSNLHPPSIFLQALTLSHCGITYEGCVSLAMALSSNSTHLKDLDLSFNYPEESGVEQLSAVLEDPHCKLEALSCIMYHLHSYLGNIQFAQK
jgi:hypothetical protein